MEYKIKKLLWDLMAFFYDKFFNYFPPYQSLLKSIINGLNNEDNNPIYILDAGCGTGILSFELAKKADNFVIIGVDNSASMLRQARKKIKKFKIKNIFLINQDLNKEFGFFINEKNKFNKVFLIHSLYLLENPNKFLKDLNYFICEKGEIFLCNPCREIHAKEFILGGKLFLKEIYYKKGFLAIYIFLIYALLMGFMNFFIQIEKKKRGFYCWNAEEIFYLLKKSGYKIKWIQKSCLGESHLLICAVKEKKIEYLCY